MNSRLRAGFRPRAVTITPRAAFSGPASSPRSLPKAGPPAGNSCFSRARPFRDRPRSCKFPPFASLMVHRPLLRNWKLVHFHQDNGMLPHRERDLPQRSNLDYDGGSPARVPGLQRALQSRQHRRGPPTFRFSTATALRDQESLRPAVNGAMQSVGISGCVPRIRTASFTGLCTHSGRLASLTRTRAWRSANRTRGKKAPNAAAQGE